MLPYRVLSVPPMANFVSKACAAAWLAFALQGAACAAPEIETPSKLAKLAPAEMVENASAKQYAQLIAQARQKQALAGPADPALQRLLSIAAKMIPKASVYNPAASRWNWEVNLIRSPQANAFCMPAGKIAFYSGLIDKLALTDDEIAAVMGHEMAHALMEHARERMAKSFAAGAAAKILGQVVGGGKYASVFETGGDLLGLKFSRDNESQADRVGVELAYLAGYDPRAAASLWRKMQALGKSGGLEILSTHPAGPERIKEVEQEAQKALARGGR